MNKDELLEENYFLSYKAFMEYLSISHSSNNMYQIIVKKKDNYEKTNVSLFIKDSLNCDKCYYFNSITLPKPLACNLINKIRNNFVKNQDISYLSVNTTTLTQNLNGYNFNLTIMFEKINEIDEALKFNNDINKLYSKKRILAKLNTAS